MRKWNATQIVVGLAVLVNVVWLIDEWPQSKSPASQNVNALNANVAKVVMNYENQPFEFSIDFNGDGIPDRLFIEQRARNLPHELVVQDNDARDLMRLPCDDEDGFVRTYEAVYKYDGKVRLLVAADSHYRPTEKHVFGWNSEQQKVVELNPLPLAEQSALKSLTTLNRNEWSEDILPDDFLWLKRFAYVFSLIVLWGIYQYQQSTLRGSHAPAQP